MSADTKKGMAGIEAGVAGMADRWHWFTAVVLVSILVLVANSHLYPDTGTDLALHLGPFRISPLSVVFALTAPQIALFCLWNMKRVKLGITDLFLVAAITYIVIRGAAVQMGISINGVGLVVIFGAHVLLIYYGAAILGQDLRVQRVVFVTLAALVVLASLYALVEFVFGRNIIYGSIIKKSLVPPEGQGYHRSGSLLGHPLALGMFITQAVPFAAFLLATAKTRKWKLILGAMIVVTMMALEVTFDKGPWLYAAIVGSLAVLWFFRYVPASRRMLSILLLSLAVSLTLLTIAFSSRLYDSTLSKGRIGQSVSPREYMWSRAPVIFRQFPIFGVGMYEGGPKVANVEPVITGDNKPTAIDNLYLLVLVEQGLAGFILLSTALALIGRQFWKLLRSGSSLVRWAMPPVICMVLTLMGGFSMDTLWMWSAMVVFWLSAGLLRALVELDQRKHSLKEPAVDG
ncbi:MAG: O-antigen ligase family protein [Thermoleophilia bacterium]